ncbi:DUF1294 domain-containing protein [Derxia lacustris]|uniref:DUF1294 domain-containing protein n=1 Tax=Derxia lacustris TaxID=764842 RepID=UPI000A174C6F|nr:cold shock and DUF1294 domain-containing protein [Derxia lacustris]
MQFTGTLKSWNDKRGFGLIETHPAGPEIFVHISAFAGLGSRPREGLRLAFEVEISPQGRKQACRLKLLHATPPAKPQRVESAAPWSWPSTLAIPAFALIYAIAALKWAVSWQPGVGYIVASVVCYCFYSTDKSIAIDNAERGGRTSRIPESTLHFLALIGGWPGAILAQQWLRHKSRKQPFRSIFWLTVVANVAAFIALAIFLRNWAWRW